MYMSMEEINIRYNGNWVFLINCNEDDLGKIIGGVVAVSSNNKNTMISEFSKYDNDSETYLTYIGEPPNDIKLLL